MKSKMAILFVFKGKLTKFYYMYTVHVIKYVLCSVQFVFDRVCTCTVHVLYMYILLHNVLHVHVHRYFAFYNQTRVSNMRKWLLRC